MTETDDERLPEACAREPFSLASARTDASGAGLPARTTCSPSAPWAVRHARPSAPGRRRSWIG